METIKSKRYVALDVLRGMTVAGMILVNNPGSWSYAFAPLEHSHWSGCTPTDLVFPFFLFCVGVSMFFSFDKRGDTLCWKSFWHVLKRSIIIFLIGLALNMFPFYPVYGDPALSLGQRYAYWFQHIRIFGVLQRIAMCYLVGGTLALWLKKPKKILICVAAVTVLHWLILWIFGPRGLDASGQALWHTLAGNISGKIDIALVGANHVYHGYGIPFDPEGVLGAISGAGTVLLGYFMGTLIHNAKSDSDAVSKLYTAALTCLGLGCVWSIWLPINKPMWTGSYVLYAGGWATMMLAFFVYFIDIKGWQKAFTPFRAMGMNPLFAFVMAGVFARVIDGVARWKVSVANPDGTVGTAMMSAHQWFYDNCCASIFGDNAYASLMYALVYVLIFLGMAMWLYRKKIIIKI
jgi:Uncharacterized conserved protein